jgi:dihydrofolate synthase/folylpolyglutamate synthase
MTSHWEKVLEELGGEKRIHYSLDNFKKALQEAGNPQNAVQSLVIAGTNGKGTTTLLITRALQLHGYKVATYLSPHLQSVCERFLDDCVPWTEERLERHLSKALPLAQKWKLSYFEFLTLLFFLDNQESKPDYCVLEVGMGGRLDATNVTHPKAVVLTNIDWDHMDFLGNTLAKILQEKMGVLRKGTPVTSGIDNPHLQQLLLEKCQELSCEVQLTQSLQKEVKELSWHGQKVMIEGVEFQLTNPSPGTLENAATAFAFLRKNFPEIQIETLQRAFSSVRNPGRFEIVQENPRVILSGDHNVAGIRCLVSTLSELGARDLFIVCGFSPDKEVKDCLSLLRPFARELVLTKVVRARGEYDEEYEKLASFEPLAEKAVGEFLRKMRPEDTLLITGSLYLIGELRALWQKEVTFCF